MTAPSERRKNRSERPIEALNNLLEATVARYSLHTVCLANEDGLVLVAAGEASAWETIAAVAPLLGLLGTVVGMIKVFAVITTEGVGNPETLAGGISEALITTAAGLVVAIPSVIFYRYFRGKINHLVVNMEEQAMQLIEILHGDREFDPDEAKQP